MRRYIILIDAVLITILFICIALLCFHCTYPPPKEAYGISFLGKDKCQVLLEWASLMQRGKYMDFDVFAHFNEDAFPVHDMEHQFELAKLTWISNPEKSYIKDIIYSDYNSRVLEKAIAIDGFRQRIPCYCLHPSKLRERCLTVWFNDAGLVTNQTIRIYHIYDSM